MMKKTIAALFLLLALPALAQQQTEKFSTFMQALPSAATPLSIEPMIVLQGGLTKQTPVSAVGQSLNTASAVTYGADPTGSSDSTSAINACLTGVGSGGTCLTAGGKYKLLGNLTIPHNTTLSCGDSFFDSEDADISRYGTLPALMLDSAHTIGAGGQGATIKNCLVYRNGMNFPAPNSSSYSGIALNDNGNNNFAVTDTVIIGFDTCIWWQGARPYGNRIFMDCAGVTHAALEEDTGNTDSGYINFVKIQPLGTGNGNCTNSVRAGTGLRVGGTGGQGIWFDNIVVQNFQVAEYDFEQSAIVGKIWIDNINGAASCGSGGFGTSIGIKTGTGVNLQINQAYISQTQTGLLLNSNGGESRVDFMAITNIGQDGIVLGTSGVASGNLSIGLLSEATIARYAVNYQDVNSTLRVQSSTLTGVNGTAAPYIFTAVSNTPLGGGSSQGAGVQFDSLITDLGAGADPYGGSGTWTVFSGGRSVAGIKATLVGCTGLGTGSCVFAGSPDSFSGLISLSPTGSPATAGSATVNTPFVGSVGIQCAGALSGGGSNWPGTATLQIQANSASQFAMNWFTNGAALVTGSAYRLTYICDYY